MSHSDIERIASETIPAAASNFFANAKCLQMSDPAMEDKAWKDVFGNSCEWYHKFRTKFPELCAGQDVRENCPQVSLGGKAFHVIVEKMILSAFTLWSNVYQGSKSSLIISRHDCLPYLPRGLEGCPSLTFERLLTVVLFRGSQACQSKFECFNNAEKPKAYFLWDRIKKIEPKHVNGTICLSSKRDENGVFNSSRDAFKLVEACRAYWEGRTDDLTKSWTDRMKEDAEIAKWMESYAGLSNDMKGKRVNITDWWEVLFQFDFALFDLCQPRPNIVSPAKLPPPTLFPSYVQAGDRGRVTDVFAFAAMSSPQPSTWSAATMAMS